MIKKLDVYIKSDDGRLRSGPGPDGGEGDDDIDESSPIRRCSIKNMITFLSEREKKMGNEISAEECCCCCCWLEYNVFTCAQISR